MDSSERSVIAQYLANQEALLKQLAKDAGIAENAVLLGAAREYFIANCLKACLGGAFEFGTGVIVDALSRGAFNGKGRAVWPQNDIVLIEPRYPRIELAGRPTIFLAESVYATIEVKSTLNRQELKRVIEQAGKLKALQRTIWNSHRAQAPRPWIVTYVVAYSSKLSLSEIEGELSLSFEQSEQGAEWRRIRGSDATARLPNLSCANVDGVFVLGKGFVLHHNSPIRVSDRKGSLHPRLLNPYCGYRSEDATLAHLFFLLVSLIDKMHATAGEVSDYFRATSVDEFL